jgi:segregation and condensation protein A
MTYTITLPTFEGPLDLLLRLIERAELDITTIALAQVADQYLAHVRTLEAADPHGIADFVSLAARLLLIKSRALLPRPVDPARDAGSADSDAEALAQQLREYQRYKQAAALLRAWHAIDRRMFLRTAAAPPAPVVSAPALLSHTVAELLAAVERRMQLRLPLDPPVVLALAPRRTVAQVATTIRERLQRMAWFSFEDLFDDVTSRQDVIVIFWAVLELLKRQVITIDQDALFGAISIGRGVHADEQTPINESEL